MRSRTSTASIAIKTSSVFAAIALAFALNAMETARALNEANSPATSIGDRSSRIAPPGGRLIGPVSGPGRRRTDFTDPRPQEQ